MEVLESVSSALLIIQSPPQKSPKLSYGGKQGNQKRMKVWGEGRAELLIRKKDRNVSSFREQRGPPGWRAGNHFVV